MFELESAIKEWKLGLRKNRGFEDGDIEELESHLRDLMEDLQKQGHYPENAFNLAIEEIGDMGTIEDEFYKTRSKRNNPTPPWKQKSWVPVMASNYLKVAFRNFKRSFTFSSINVFGLAIGIACCIVITLFIRHEYSYDTFHSKADRIFRVNKVVTEKTHSSEELHALTSGPMGIQMKEDYPDIEEVVRIRNWFDEVLVTVDDTHIKIPDLVFVDSTFFDVFDFELLSGNPKTVLSQPLTAVLSEKTAALFFRDENPIGKTLTAVNGYEFTVTGIVEDAPENSHIQYDMLVSWSSVGPSGLNFSWMDSRWFPQAIYTYLLLNPTTEAANLESQLPKFMQHYFPERAESYELYLQPFSEIYLQSSDILWVEPFKVGSSTSLRIFMVVAGLILLIACINFMNLSTAQATKRAEEVGIRKVYGAYRHQLASQFLGESILYSVSAFILSILLVVLSKPLLSYVQIDSSFLSINDNISLLVLMFIGSIVVGVLAGLYPSAILSAFKPVSVLYNRKTSSIKGAGFRKALVVVQFSLSIGLIIGTLVIYKQLDYAVNSDLGFEKEQVIVLPIGDTEISDSGEAFKDELLKYSNILSASGSTSYPGSTFSSYGIEPDGVDGSDTDWISNVLLISDHALLDTYGFELTSGRYFEPGLSSDSIQSVVINQTLADALGWENPVGKRLDVPGNIPEGYVIGVIKDFHTRSFRQDIEPLVIFMTPRWDNISVKISSQNISETLAFIESTWQEFDPVHPFEYEFIDQVFAQLYDSENRMRSLLTLFSGFAILVACLGLFGLSIFSTNNRIKEIGIRKVLGSSVFNIVVLLSKDFVVLVILGFLISAPASYYIINQWLNDFTYRTSVGILPFIIAGSIVLILALVTISSQAIRAAYMNPVKSLKNE